MISEYKFIRIEREGATAHLLLNRPQVLNAMHQPGAEEVAAAAQSLAEDDTLRMVVIRGEGRAFCTGIDLKALAAGEIDMAYFRLWEEALRAFETMDKLVLALMHGHVVGGGLQLALACDIRAATHETRLSAPAINEGLIPGLATLRLARFVGHGRAKRLILSGDPVTGAEALKIGLVDHLVPEDAREPGFEALIDKYGAVNSEGCRLAKRALADAFDLAFEPFLERYMALQERAFRSADFKEAITAYRDGRPPRWK